MKPTPKPDPGKPPPASKPLPDWSRDAPWLGAAFCICVLVIAGIVAKAMADGQFKARGDFIISRAGDPFVFWLSVSLMGALGLVLMTVPLRFGPCAGTTSPAPWWTSH